MVLNLTSPIRATHQSMSELVTWKKERWPVVAEAGVELANMVAGARS